MEEVNIKRNYEIRRATRQDQESIGRAWRKAYSDYDFPFPYLFPERYEWLIYGNPFLKRQGQGMPIWIAKKDDEVAAWTVAMEVPVELNGRTWRGAWGNLAFTLSEHRRQGLAVALQGNYERTYEIFIGLGMSRTNRKLQYVAGGRTGKPLFIYLKLLKRFDADALYASFLSFIRKRRSQSWENLFALLGRFGLRGLLCIVLGVLFKAGQRKRNLQENEKMFAEEVKEFGRESDRLWQQVRDNYAFAVSRGSEYLNWKYIQQPHLKYQRYLFKDKAGQLQGLMVYRMSKPPELPQGIITEILLRQDDATRQRQMLEFAEDRLRHAGAHMILCGASTDVQRKALEEHGFRMIYSNVPVIICPQKTWDRTDYDRALSGQWLLSLGDSDQDMVHLRNQPFFSSLIRILTGTVPGTENLQMDPQEIIAEYDRKVAERKKPEEKAKT